MRDDLRRALRPPRCPDHPRNHPLTALVVAGTAEWTCPTTGLRVCDVGRLAQELPNSWFPDGRSSCVIGQSSG